MTSAPSTTLRGVHYYEIEDDIAGYYGDASPSAHVVDMGVGLEYEEGTALSLFWVNPRMPDGDYAGHLVAVDRATVEVLPGPDRPRYEVIDWPEWRCHKGRRVERLEHIWHPGLPWRIAVRIVFDDDAVVTVALGDTNDAGDVRFSIDTLLVFHDDAKARAYLSFLSTEPASFSKVLPASDLT